MGEKYFEEFASKFSWVKHIFGNLVPIISSPELVGTLPQALFFLQKNGPHISGSPELVGTLPQAPFFSHLATIFLEAFNFWARCRRRFFFLEKWLSDF